MTGPAYNRQGSAKSALSGSSGSYATSTLAPISSRPTSKFVMTDGWNVWGRPPTWKVISVDAVPIREARGGRAVTVPVARPRRWSTRHQPRARNAKPRPEDNAANGHGTAEA